MTNNSSSDVPGTTMPGSSPLGTPSGRPSTTTTDPTIGTPAGTGVGTGAGTGVTTPGTTGTTGATGTTGSKPPLGDEAKSVAQDAGDAGRRVADVAKDETRAVADETRYQVRRLADQVGGEVREQAATQQTRAAQGIRSIGSDFSQMAEGGAPTSGFANDLARRAGRKADEVAQWLDARDPGDLLQEVKSFARRRPGVFLAIAVGAGILAGRLTRALTAPDDDRGATTYGTTPRSARVPTSGVGMTGTTAMGGTPVTGRPDLAADRFPETTSAEGAPYPAEGGGLR
jgi:hypothetical protein